MVFLEKRIPGGRRPGRRASRVIASIRLAFGQNKELARAVRRQAMSLIPRANFSVPRLPVGPKHGFQLAHFSLRDSSARSAFT